MAKARTVFEYKVDYEGARAKAEKLGRAICRRHPEIAYRVEIKTGEGAYLVLYGPEEQVRRIAEMRSRRQVDWLLAGTPVYIIYGGSKAP